MQSAECRIEVKVSIIPNSAIRIPHLIGLSDFPSGQLVQTRRNVKGSKEMKGIAFAKEFRDVLQFGRLKIRRGDHGNRVRGRPYLGFVATKVFLCSPA